MKKILVVDDSELQRAMMGEWLDNALYEVTYAVDGKEGLYKTIEIKPDLIILDVLMPKLTGYEFVKKMRQAGGEFSDIPIIVLTSRENMEEYFDSWQITDFLVKGLPKEEFLKKVQEALLASEEDSDGILPITPLANSGLRFVVAGAQDFVVFEIREYLKKLGMKCEVVLSDDYVADTVVKQKPDFLLCQYWEDSQNFDAQKIFFRLKGLEQVKNVRMIFYCSDRIGLEADKDLKGAELITYSSLNDFMQKLKAVISEK